MKTVDLNSKCIFLWYQKFRRLDNPTERRKGKKGDKQAEVPELGHRAKSGDAARQGHIVSPGKQTSRANTEFAMYIWA